MKHTKEQPMQHKPPLVIDITLTRGLLALLALALVTATFLGYLAWGQKEAAAAPASAAAFTGMRKYYLTQSQVDGDEALTACAAGYHMASLWEILNPSNLAYNTSLGYTQADSGTGPPTSNWGWVRTGAVGGWDTGTIGVDSCAAWTRDDTGAFGAIVMLSNSWTGGVRMHVWSMGSFRCDQTRRVWCVED